MPDKRDSVNQSAAESDFDPDWDRPVWVGGWMGRCAMCGGTPCNKCIYGPYRLMSEMGTNAR